VRRLSEVLHGADLRTRLLIAASISSAAVVVSHAAPPFVVSHPAIVVDLDVGKLKGVPTALAWSTHDGEFYLQTVDDDRKLRHFLVRSTSDPQGLDEQPAWAATYWNWKSGRVVPGHPELVIEVATATKTGQVPSQSLREKAAGMSNPGTAMRGAVDASNDRQNVRTLLLKGEVIGEYIDAPLVPGLTFGWSPEKLHAVAYVPHSGRLMLMDVVSGEKQEVESTSSVSLPAWSSDGSRIVFLEKTGRKKYALMQVTVSPP
jgi:hypothetical protein